VTSTPAQTHTQLIDQFTAALTAANPNAPLSVVLIGSAARNAATAESDLDLLVLTDDGLKMVPTPGPLHVQAMTGSTFRDRLRSGDDFAAWCVRLGIPIVRSELWDSLVQSPEASTWPDWRQKIEHATRRLLLASSLRETGDLDAATEELTYAVSHVARAILLKNNVFPLSRPEIIAQLKELGYPSLADTLLKLSYGERSDRQTKRAMIYVKRLLVHLDKDRFKKYVDNRREARLKKGSTRNQIRL
jgi:Nucleotidyltransferase domain